MNKKEEAINKVNNICEQDFSDLIKWFNENFPNQITKSDIVRRLNQIKDIKNELEFLVNLLED